MRRVDVNIDGMCRLERRRGSSRRFEPLRDRLTVSDAIGRFFRACARWRENRVGSGELRVVHEGPKGKRVIARWSPADERAGKVGGAVDVVG